MSDGRPLRFLFLAVGGWTALRAFALWPVPEIVIPSARAASPSQAAMIGPIPFPTVAAFARIAQIASVRATSRTIMPSPFAVCAPSPGAEPLLAAEPLLVAQSQRRSIPTILTIPPLTPPFEPMPLATPPSRWAASVWAIIRGGTRGSLLGGQLGASQAGARITYLVDRGERIALAARIATPLTGRGRELGLGIDWQPLRVPLHLIAEQRIGLDGNRGGPTVEVVGGFGPVDIAPRIQAEGYGQAGGIARDGIQGFADGAARIAYRLTEKGRARLDLGVGAWGGAQRGAARLDVGPSLGLVAPVGGKVVRLTLDWRRRIAGDAAPGSGPALTIGSDF